MHSQWTEEIGDWQVECKQQHVRMGLLESSHQIQLRGNQYVIITVWNMFMKKSKNRELDNAILFCWLFMGTCIWYAVMTVMLNLLSLIYGQWNQITNNISWNACKWHGILMAHENAYDTENNFTANNRSFYHNSFF